MTFLLCSISASLSAHTYIGSLEQGNQKENLKSKFQKLLLIKIMSTTHISPGATSVRAYITIKGCVEAIEFYKKTF